MIGFSRSFDPKVTAKERKRHRVLQRAAINEILNEASYVCWNTCGPNGSIILQAIKLYSKIGDRAIRTES